MKIFFKKTAEELAQEEKERKVEQERIEKKNQVMRDSIKSFKGKLCENFILGNTMSKEFKDSFKSQLEKQGLSATKRWCQSVVKKLAKLDKRNYSFRNSNEHFWIMNKNYPCGIMIKDGSLEAEKALKAKNIVEFKKIFYTTKRFGGALLGIELKVKATFSQKAAVNEVKKELNDLCISENFKSKQARSLTA